MSPAKKKGLTRRGHPDLSISQQCRLVKLSRSAFYYAPVGINAVTLKLMKAIDRLFTKYPFFGSRQIAAYLRRDGIIAGRHRVRRLMAKMGLEAIYKRPRTSQPIQLLVVHDHPFASQHHPDPPVAKPAALDFAMPWRRKSGCTAIFATSLRWG